MARPSPFILLILLLFMSSLCLGGKIKKSYNVRHKNQWWKIETTGEKGHNYQKVKGQDYQKELDEDTDDENKSNGTASNDTESK